MCGRRVRWTSQAKGVSTTKDGVVIATIPAGMEPWGAWLVHKERNPSAKRMFDAPRARTTTSYLIAVGTYVYWPRTANLQFIL